MKRSVLPLLACPAPLKRGRCDGPLSLHAALGLPLRTADGDSDEVAEGGLRCSQCGTEYPIVAGVAILVPAPDDYLRRYYRSVVRDLDRHGTLSSEGRTWLRRRYGRDGGRDDYGADFRFSQQFEEPWDVARAMTAEPEALYGPFAEWLQQIGGKGPYEVLAGWAAEARERHLVLDAGCGVGGLLARVAPHFGAALGVDLSFLAVLLARRALLHQPEPERTYFLPVRRNEEVERPLPIRPARNAELVVGDCAALPFPEGLFDAVCSSNVIDIAGMEPTLDAAARVLRPGGSLLLSDPFYFREGEAPPGEPRAAVRAALEERGLRVERELDAVPWAWATYDRHWRLYFNYCAAARKLLPGGEQAG